jgi:hypothetical protein
MLKRITVMLLMLVFAYMAVAPETLAHNRKRRANYRAYNQGFRSYNQGYYYNQGYRPYRYRGVASDRYYRGFRSRRNGLGSTGRAILTVAAPAAIAAGVGALIGGKKGAAVGALLGGGGGAAYHLIRNRRDRDRYRFRR